MAFSEHGDNKYVFSFGSVDAAALETLLGIAPQTLSLSGAAEYDAKAEGVDGTVQANAVADDMRTFTLSGYLVDLTKFEAAVSFTYDGKYYIIKGRKHDIGAKEYQKAEFTGEHFPGITAAVV